MKQKWEKEMKIMTFFAPNAFFRSHLGSTQTKWNYETNRWMLLLLFLIVLEIPWKRLKLSSWLFDCLRMYFLKHFFNFVYNFFIRMTRPSLVHILNVSANPFLFLSSLIFIKCLLRFENFIICSAAKKSFWRCRKFAIIQIWGTKNIVIAKCSFLVFVLVLGKLDKLLLYI